MGLSYDWSREIDTSNPDYFKWTQFLFLKLYEKGLVYESEEAVWWCEELKSVLANEEVIEGRSERGDHPCIKKKLKQWVIKITAYADRLLADLDELDWPESIKKMQREWIGRTHGIDIKFAIDGTDETVEIFSHHPETLFGVNAIILATDHELAKKLTDLFLKRDIGYEINQLELGTENEMSAIFTGSYAIHPITKNKLPIYLSNYFTDYSIDNANLCVPSANESDALFSKKMDLNWINVISEDLEGNKILQNSDFLNNLTISNAKKEIYDWLIKHKCGKEVVRYKLRDWLFSRQRYWGEPFPLYKNSEGKVIPAQYDELPICLPTIHDYAPSSDGSSPLQRVNDWIEQIDKLGNQLFRITDTMPGWAGSCWYYLRFMDPHNKKEPFSQEAMQYWGTVDLYVGGAAHGTMHLIYARFWHKVLYDIGIVNYKEPFKKLFNQGLITAEAFKDESGRIVAVDEAEERNGLFYLKGTDEALDKFNTKMSKSLLNIVTPDSLIQKYGVDAFRLYMLFLGPLDKNKKWDINGIVGCERFINRVWSLFCDAHDILNPSVLNSLDKGRNNLWPVWQRSLKRVSSSFNDYNFNTAVAAFMEFINAVDKDLAYFDFNIASQFLIALSPFAPHICEELWEKLGYTELIAKASWPSYELNTAKKMKVMVNGKLIDYLDVADSKEENQSMALEISKQHLKDKVFSHIIYVEGKIINIVTN